MRLLWSPSLWRHQSSPRLSNFLKFVQKWKADLDFQTMYAWLQNSRSFSLMDWILNILWDFQMPTTEPLTTMKHFSCVLVIWCLASLPLLGIETITPSRAVKKWKLHAGVDKPILEGPSKSSLVAQMVKNLPAMQETEVQSLHGEDLLEKGMATHSSLAWRIP